VVLAAWDVSVTAPGRLADKCLPCQLTDVASAGAEPCPVALHGS
jgi:hypothetical protein